MAFPDNLPSGWRKLLAPEADKDYFQKLVEFLKVEWSQGKKIFPPRDLVLRALQEVDYPDVKIVVLGQDPYHGDGQAIGRSFAVPNDFSPKPPSLLNIFKEIESDIGFKWNKQDSELSGWSKQGVLLLNTLLTVEASKPLSHLGKGWEIFTDLIIKTLNERSEPIIFFLWGANAQKKRELITNSQHKILTAPHPSPLSASRGFFGSKHFSKANEILQKNQLHPIDWTHINA